MGERKRDGKEGKKKKVNSGEEERRWEEKTRDVRKREFASKRAVLEITCFM